MPQPASPRRPLALLALGLLVVAVAAGGCVGERPTLADVADTTTTSTTLPPAPAPVLRAEARDTTIDVFATFDTTVPERTISADDATSAPGIPLVFLVRDERGSRYQVLLPTEPSGSTGWIDRADVEVAAVDHRIEVDLGGHRIRVHRGDELVVDEPIAVGPDRPAPGTDYFLTELLQSPRTDGPYGPFAYGLSGFQTVLDHFNDGQGVVGLHGTDRPDDLGQDAPTGSVHLHNDVVRRLVDDLGLPLGTPVEVTP